MYDADNESSETPKGDFKMSQLVFKRYEVKYFLPAEKYEAFRNRLSEYMSPDQYAKYTISNIYFDTEDFSLVRTSIEKPVYKEKLRLRAYGVPDADDTVFLEIKKKYDGVVYKRREELKESEAESYFAGGCAAAPAETQIWRELTWFREFYRPVPKLYLAYDREALSGIENPELRLTFDRNIRWRDTELNLRRGDHGQLLLPDDAILMEIKIPGTAPLWLAELLSEFGLFPTSFSKYGDCYKKFLLKKQFAAKVPEQEIKFTEQKVKHYA